MNSKSGKITLTGKYNTASVMIDSIDQATETQIFQFLNHPAFQGPEIVIQPDTHSGMGSVIGFTMPLTENNVGPAIVGVDIGCGMLSLRLDCDSMDYERLHSVISSKVPHGIAVHDSPVIRMEEQFPWQEAARVAGQFARAHNEKFASAIHQQIPRYDQRWFMETCRRIGIDIGRAQCSLGTLGGGNHFIEIDRDPEKRLWMTIHSGSRNFGLKVCEYWLGKGSSGNRKKSRQEISQEIDALREQAVTYAQKKELPAKIKEIKARYKEASDTPRELTFLKGEMAWGYLFDMIFSQLYASLNRQLIADQVAQAMGFKFLERIETVHNYIDFQDLIIRKGAISAHTGERVIIPFNMAYGVALCRGRGKADWNWSAPHGAGRLMSRAQARRKVSLQDFKDSMSHVKSWCVGSSTLDESPMAYKDPGTILEAITETVDIEWLMKPTFNFKDTSDSGWHGRKGR